MQDLKTLIINEFSARFTPTELYVTKTDVTSYLNVTPKKSDEPKEPIVISKSAVEEIKNRSGVTSVSPMITMLSMTAYLESDTVHAFPNAQIVGWDISGKDSFFKNFTGKESLGLGEAYVAERFVQYHELTDSEIIGKYIVVKANPASLFGSNIKNLQSKSYKLKVVGVVSGSTEKVTAIMSMDQAAQINTEIGGYDSIAEYVEKAGYDQVRIDTDLAKTTEIKEWLVNDKKFNVMSSDDIISIISTVTDGLTLALIMFGTIAAIVASVGIINTMIMSIYEQTREIGVLKAIGASNRQILVIYLIQSGLIGFIGGAMGLLIVLGSMAASDPKIVSALAEAGFEVSQFFHIDPVLSIQIAVASILVGVLAGIYPSMKAARLDPVKALRYE